MQSKICYFYCSEDEQPLHNC